MLSNIFNFIGVYIAKRKCENDAILVHTHHTYHILYTAIYHEITIAILRSREKSVCGAVLDMSHMNVSGSKECLSTNEVQRSYIYRFS